MSYQAVSAVLAHSKSKGSDRLVLLVLAAHAGEEVFECYPGRDLLCKEAAMSERNLIYCLKSLEESGEITITRGNGRGNLTTYRIVLGQVEEGKRVQATAPFIPQERVQSAASFSEVERVQNPAKRVQDSVERVQNPVIKGAKSGSAYKDIESSGNSQGIEGEKNTSGADAPRDGKPEGKKSTAKKTQTPKSPFHNHPSVVIYRQVYRTVNADQARLIAEATGVEVASPPVEWSAFVSELALTGNKHAHNVRVMVLAYERYRAGANLADALNAAWNQEKGRNVPAVNGTLNGFSPAAQQTIAALDDFVKCHQEGL